MFISLSNDTCRIMRVVIVTLIFGIFLLSSCTNSQLIRDIESKYDVELNSYREESKETRYSNEFKICERGERSDTCKPHNYRDFNDLKVESTYVSKILSKAPDKFFAEQEINENNKVIHTIALCVGDTNEIWDSQYPDIILSQTGWDCNSGNFGAERLERIKQALVSIWPRVRPTTLDGRDVLEISGRESSGKLETEGFLFLNADDYSPYKTVEEQVWEPFDLLVGGEEVTHFRLSKKVKETLVFGLNDVEDREFVFPENIAHLRRCSYTTEEADRGGELFRSDLERTTSAEAENQQPMSETDFNSLENARVNIPSNKCNSLKPRLYSEYLASWGTSGWDYYGN